MIISGTRLLQVKRKLSNLKFRYRKYSTGLTKKGKAKTLDRGFTAKEASGVLSKLNTLYAKLPLASRGRNLPKRVKVSSSVLRQAQSLTKSLSSHKLAFQTKLSRPLNQSAATKPRRVARVGVRARLTVVRQELAKLNSGPKTTTTVNRRHRLEHVVRQLTNTSKKRNTGGFIYKITEKSSGKVYIGQTIQTVEARVRQHLTNDRIPGVTTKFDKVFRKRGRGGFRIATVARASSKKQLDTLERKFINKFGSTNPRKGFNTVAGNYNKVLGTKIASLNKRIFKAKNNPKKLRSLKAIRSRLRRIL